MTEFDQRRDLLARARREAEAKRKELLLAREAQRRQEDALQTFTRSHTQRRIRERAVLEHALQQARATTNRLNDELAGLRAEAGERLDAFSDFTDPRTQIVQLSDQHPILLFPLRLETRFKTAANGQPQLWVRIYPDNCLIDTFEPSLTESEVKSAQTFWSGIWRAGADEALEREAWRQLVAAHGSGRAGWIVRNHLPLNPNDKQTKVAPSDVLLIIVAPAALPAAALTYWETAWKADGAPAALQAAYATLVGTVGAALARDILEHHRPFNFADTPTPPRTRADVRVQAVVLQMPASEHLEIRRTSWSSPARIELLPERFVVVGYQSGAAVLTAMGDLIRTPLVATPDPNAPPEQQLKRRAPPDDDELEIPDDITWMFDFDKAVEVGMALRIDLTSTQLRGGFERLVVLGVRLSDSPEEGRTHLAHLLEHHLHSRSGLEILPQGTPTNNTEKGGARYSSKDDADASFDLFMRGTPQYSSESDPLRRRDGQWFAELLGLPHELVQRFPNARGADQSEARAMQIALWPATLGYMLHTLLAPVFSDDDVRWTRTFFTRYVSGRGPLPALRIGKQPYGILLTTAFARITWFDNERDVTTAGRLYAVLKRADADWQRLVERVNHVGKAGDPHQVLLDVLGLHPGSVDYYSLQAESVDHKFHELSFVDFSVALDFVNRFPTAIPLAMLRSYGYTAAQIPDLMNKVYQARQTPLTGPVIDDVPLSENAPLRTYAGTKNYIEWLIDAARTGVEALQSEQGFDGGKRPTALLYLLLRNALQLSFHEAGVRLGLKAGVIQDAAGARREPPFVHVSHAGAASESRYSQLFAPEARITGSDRARLGDYIARNVMTVDPDLAEQLAALEWLRGTPTARLERVFAEHIDCCSYRLDAWKVALFAMQLEQMRQRGSPATEVSLNAERASPELTPGLYLGAYGWLEPLRPQTQDLKTADLSADIATPVNKRDKTPLRRDSTNLGLIHAPSVNHATTAAVLRNGYEANEGQLAINLSSRRVRLALGILEGMRNGQSLGALLGYHLERYIHDHGPLPVRALVYPLRYAFPLVANQITKTNTETGEPQESIAAMNVVDGRKLVEHTERQSNFVYPFGVDSLPRPSPDDGQEQTITDALAYIRDINDAVADLVLAEGVHQAVIGNYERSAGMFDAFAKGNYPPEPDIVRTPRTGIALTLRTAIHLPYVAPPTVANPLPPNPPPAAVTLTPLSITEPAINIWLAGRLPDPATVGCNVSYTDRGTGNVVTEFISQTQLGLQPIDVLYRTTTGEATPGDLDDRIVEFVQAHRAPRHDRAIRIQHTERVANRYTWFELQALLRSLRALLVGARPLRPADLMRANDSTSDQQGMLTVAVERVRSARDELNGTRLTALNAVATALGNPAVTIDDALGQYASTVSLFAEYRLPQTGTSFVYDWRMAAYARIKTQLVKRVDAWNRRLRKFNDALANYDSTAGLLSESERITALQAAEMIIATAVTSSTFADSVAFRGGMDTRRDDFTTLRDSMQQLLDGAWPSVTTLLANAKALGPLAAFDHEELDFSADDAEVERFRRQLTNSVANLKADTVKRIARVDEQLAAHATTASSDGKVKVLQEAAKVLFGEDFQLIPQITLPQAAADEMENAWQHSTSGKLTEFLTTTRARDFPVDDWLHGVARVRDKLRQWENVALLSDALGAIAGAELVPLQLPYAPNDPWLALEFPNAHKIASDRLLYTAHFAEPFDKNKPICGVVVDEWTEVVPGTQETTGIAFHYDRPNSEPPQSWLLALPAVRNGAWSWDELLDAVNHTLDAAKSRAVEPAHLDATPYSWFLPATMSAYTFPEISISSNLLQNVKIYVDAARNST